MVGPSRTTARQKRKGIDGRAHKEWNLRLEIRPSLREKTSFSSKKTVGRVGERRDTWNEGPLEHLKPRKPRGEP